MTTIFLIRHGEAAASWQQDADPGLSDRGRAQAAALVAQLDPLPITAILSSPMRRARETAAPLAAQRSLPVQILQPFREIPTPASVELADRLAWLKGCAQQSWDEVDGLLVEWRRELLESLLALEGNVVVFTHFMVMNAVLGAMQNQSKLVCYQPDYCSVMTLSRLEKDLTLIDLGCQAASRVL